MIEREISTPGVSYQYRRYTVLQNYKSLFRKKKRMNNTATKRPASKTLTHYYNAQDMQSRNTETKQEISACNHASICRIYVKPSHLSTHLHIDMWSYLLDMLGAQEHGRLRTTSRKIRHSVTRARESYLELVVCEPPIQTGFQKCSKKLAPPPTKGMCFSY